MSHAARAIAADLRLVWSDEFDGPAGAPVDPAVWTHEVGDGSAQGNPGWGNRELQRYTGGSQNAALDGDGNLAITARRDEERGFTSARLVTKGKLELRYGRIEARARVPRGAGLWPAVWALGADIDRVGWPECGEIDVAEVVGREPRFGGTLDLPRSAADAFHVFAVDWQPRRLAWTVDDRLYHEAAPEDVAPHAWVFEHPFFLVVNLAVGGDFGGPVASATRFPQRLLVDYLRVYERTPSFQ